MVGICFGAISGRSQPVHPFERSHNGVELLFQAAPFEMCGVEATVQEFEELLPLTHARVQDPSEGPEWQFQTRRNPKRSCGSKVVFALLDGPAELVVPRYACNPWKPYVRSMPIQQRKHWCIQRPVWFVSMPDRTPFRMRSATIEKMD